jgi:hypothetical protein
VDVRFLGGYRNFLQQLEAVDRHRLQHRWQLDDRGLPVTVLLHLVLCCYAGYFDVACAAAACCCVASRQLDLWAACKTHGANIGGCGGVRLTGLQLLRYNSADCRLVRPQSLYQQLVCVSDGWHRCIMMILPNSRVVRTCSLMPLIPCIHELIVCCRRLPVCNRPFLSFTKC